MPFNVADGSYSEAPSVLPLEASASPAVAGVTPVAGQLTPSDQTPGRDLTGERLGQLASYEQDITAAQHAGMGAEHDRRAGYQAQALPLGGQIGDVVDLPLVPDAATPAVQSDLYPYAGMEPTPAGVGFYHGNEPALPE